VGGVEVIHEVSWTFAFAGTDSASSDAPVTDSSTVTVSSSSTILQSGSNKVLLDGDSNQDAHGNKVTINAGGKLTSG
jgi:hypothetical protein